MRRDSRRSVRRVIRHRAWIDVEDGSPVRECLIGNMSDTGAKLIFDTPTRLPGFLVLWLSQDGRVARRCRLVWIAGHEAGVAFMPRLMAAPARAAQA